MAKKTAGEDPGKLASDFHRGLSEMLVAACETLRAKRSMNTVALSGGVFQNKYLTQLTAEKLEKRGFDVLLHRLIPPNDGGIALGQAVAAMSRLCK
jgi:hydrogenase maturation protein HypF